MPYELDVVVVCDSPSAVISNPIDHSDAYVLNRTEQVLVSNQVSRELCYQVLL